MKFYLMNLLLLSSFLTYKAQGIRLGKIDLSTSNLQDIVKISSVKRSIQDDEVLAKSAIFSSGINRKLTTKSRYSNTINSDSENQKKHDLKLQLKSTRRLGGKEGISTSSPENSKQLKKDVISEKYQDVTDIAEMDYSPARKKSPIHN